MAVDAFEAGPRATGLRDSARRVVSEPLLPVALLGVALATSTALGAAWPAWVFFAVLAGHSLSGST
jgi:hypothetical protein